MNLITSSNVLMLYRTYTQRPVGKLPDEQFKNLDFRPGFAIILLHILTGQSILLDLFLSVMYVWISVYPHSDVCVLCVNNIYTYILIFNLGDVFINPISAFIFSDISTYSEHLTHTIWKNKSQH